MSRKSAKQVMQEAYDSQAIIVRNQQKELNELNREVSNYKIYASIRKEEGSKKEFRINSKYFYKGFKRNIIELLSDNNLSSSEIKILFFCAPFLEKETNMVMNINGDRATEQDLLNFVNMTRKTFDKALKELADKDILYKIQKTQKLVNFIMNPKYFFVGQDDSVCMQDIFELQKTAKVDENDT